MMRRVFILFLALAAGCHYSRGEVPLVAIQIQDRNGLTETISSPDRLSSYETLDFLNSQPYKKVLRVFKSEGKNSAKITTYHSNGLLWQYLEAQEMRANGAYREWFSNGQLKIEARVIGGTADVGQGSQQDWLFDGLSQAWDEEGTLVAKIHYEKGMLEGPSLYFYPNGRLEKEIPFVNNLMEGEMIEYTPEGQIKAKIQYKKGQKHGTSLVYFESGQIAREEGYTEGLLLTGSYHNPQGELVADVENGGGFQAIYEGDALTLIEFRMGRPDGVMKQFTSDGELHKSILIKNRKKHGEEIEFYLVSDTDAPAGKNSPIPKLSVQWNDNAIHGTVKTWYNNGARQSEREYCRNKKQGPALAWYRDGNLMLVEEYEEDRLVKGQYFKINSKEPVSTIVNGTGTTTLYDETGAYLRKVSYVKGKPVDPQE